MHFRHITDNKNIVYAYGHGACHQIPRNNMSIAYNILAATLVTKFGLKKSSGFNSALNISMTVPDVTVPVWKWAEIFSFSGLQSLNLGKSDDFVFVFKYIYTMNSFCIVLATVHAYPNSDFCGLCVCMCVCGGGGGGGGGG